MDIGDGAWCWFNEPRALITEDVTILGWVGRDGDIRVASYNNDTGVVVKRTLHESLQVDDHANPAFYLRHDGRITAFYSRHAGKPLYYRTTTQPARIAEWGPERTFPTNTPGGYGYTYPNPIWSPLDQKLYLFWRGGNFLPTMSTSDDEGETWTQARKVMDDNEPHASMRPYVKYACRDGVIHLAYTQAHPNSRATSIFYVRFTPGVGWERANGADAGPLPLIPTDGDRIFDAWQHEMRAWVHDVAVGADGHPRIAFASFSRSTGYTDHRYWYARWDGAHWHMRQITQAGPSIDPDGELQYSAGMALDHDHPEILYMARKKGSWFQVEVWKTPDGGAHWDITPITSGAENHMRPVVPRNQPSPDSAQVLFMHGRFDSYTDYKTTIALTNRSLV
jgi:hypothetical protein